MNNPNYESLIKMLKTEYAPSAWLGHIEFVMFLVNQFKPQTIVELGVDYGHSTFSLASEGQGTIYAIDSFEGDIHTGIRNTYPTVNSVYNTLLKKQFLPRDNIIFIKGYFDNIFAIFDKPIDLIHIDGLHTYEAVKNDFEKWKLKVVHNGIIIMHDITSFPDTVGKFFNEIEYPKTYVSHSAGLGIICKNEEIINLINELWVHKLYTADGFIKHKDYPNFNIRI
jgi:hypothetical protein